MTETMYSDLVAVLKATERVVGLDARMRDAAGLAAKAIEELVAEVGELRSQRGQVLDSPPLTLIEDEPTHQEPPRDEQEEPWGSAAVAPGTLMGGPEDLEPDHPLSSAGAREEDSHA